MATASPDSSNCSNVLATTTLLKSTLGSAAKIIYHYKHIQLKHIDHNCNHLYYFVCVFHSRFFWLSVWRGRAHSWSRTHPFLNFRMCQKVFGRLHCPDISQTVSFLQLISEFCFIINDFLSSLCHLELNSLFSPLCYVELSYTTTV